MYHFISVLIMHLRRRYLIFTPICVGAVIVNIPKIKLKSYHDISIKRF